LATIIEFIGYILFYTLVDDEDIFIEIYEEKSPEKLVKKKNNNPNINMSMRTPNYSNEELNIDSKYDTPTPYKDNYNFDKKIAKLEEEFSGNGRVLIRASGTEPKVRVMIEGDNQEYITKKAQELAIFIEKRLN
jgi:phosphoglucosamine mutase